jgi:Tn3 transposase DDE domain-containing protein
VTASLIIANSPPIPGRTASPRLFANNRASGLNLVVSAIILWNTRYLERAADVLRKFEDVPDSLLAHLSPLGWEHVNLTGDYVWGVEQSLSENIDGLRSLRTQADALQKAA